MNLKELERKLALARERGAVDESEVHLENGIATMPIAQVWLSREPYINGQVLLVIRYDDDASLPGDLHDSPLP